MIKLETLYSSNIPIDCHILKGRLETEGLDCFIFDENIVWVHPFKAVAIGGVKLKVPSDQFEIGNEIIKQLNRGKLIDENGEYGIAEIFHSEFEKQLEILKIKSDIRKNLVLIDKPNEIDTKVLNRYEIDLIIESEKDFQILYNKKLNFTLKNFLYELFDFDRSIFSYLRIRPVEYYLDKEIVDKLNSMVSSNSSDFCPICSSNNVKYGYAIDYKWDILYLILSLIFAPFPLIRKNFHCFDCGYDFTKKKSATNSNASCQAK